LLTYDIDFKNEKKMDKFIINLDIRKEVPIRQINHSLFLGLHHLHILLRLLLIHILRIFARIQWLKHKFENIISIIPFHLLNFLSKIVFLVSEQLDKSINDSPRMGFLNYKSFKKDSSQLFLQKVVFQF